MYDELVKRLRICPDYNEGCVNCPHEHDLGCRTTTMHEAADAIEKLSKRETPIRVRITTSTKRCPSCNKQLSGRGNIHSNYRFCRWCGQALDWAVPPKEE